MKQEKQIEAQLYELRTLDCSECERKSIATQEDFETGECDVIKQ